MRIVPVAVDCIIRDIALSREEKTRVNVWLYMSSIRDKPIAEISYIACNVRISQDLPFQT